jgi:hypothetical protein
MMPANKISTTEMPKDIHHSGPMKLKRAPTGDDGRREDPTPITPSIHIVNPIFRF